jgi:hypothetical protein
MTTACSASVINNESRWSAAMSSLPNSPGHDHGVERAGPARRRWPPLRIAVVVLAGAETCFMVFYIGLMATLIWSSDALGRAIGKGVVFLAAVPLILLVLPALTMGLLNRWLTLALVLALVAVATALMLFHTA